MFVLSLCRQLCPDKLPVQPGERIGQGSDGEVLDVVGDPNKVIKLGIIYDSPVRPSSYYTVIQQVLDYVMHARPPAYVRVYQHGYLGQFERLISRKNQSFVIYYYLMEKLEKLTEDEHKVFHSIVSHEDRGIKKDYPIQKIEDMLRGMARGLDFDTNKVILFYQDLRRLPILHLDVSPRNIMKDASGNYKLVDIDRAYLLPSDSISDIVDGG